MSAALPASLREQQVDVRILIPGYPQVLAGLKYKRKVAEFNDLAHFPLPSYYQLTCKSIYRRVSQFLSSIVLRYIKEREGPI